MGLDTKTTEKSFSGVVRDVMKLRKYQFDSVLDLHDVIRSRIVDFIFRLNGKKVVIIDKRRRERKRLVARPPKITHLLRPVTERYADVFRKAGFCFEETFVSLFAGQAENTEETDAMFGDKKGRWIGIAPFAKHQGKVYPAEKMERVVQLISEQERMMIFLFGGRGVEEKILNRWAMNYKNTVSVAGKFLLDRELALINRLDVLVSMDSANMHFASLVGTKVISIWGATHPLAGFYGYHQREDLAIQVDLPCRPCSIYGKKTCYRGDWACLNQITPEQIIQRINDYLKTL
jgi:ADP-heptose:LPS heptosyltransferase